MRPIRSILVISFLLLAALPGASATAQNDAGLGHDAPATSGGAEPILLGTQTGIVRYNEGDLEDWYRIVIPSGATLTLTFRATSGSLWGGIHQDSGGALVVNGFSSGNTVTLHAGQGAWRIGFGDQAGSGVAGYTFTATPVNPARHDDAQLGRDAGSVGGAADGVAPGVHSGTVFYHSGDLEDWYYFPGGCGTITVTFRAVSGGLWGGIYGDVDGFLGNAYSSGGERTLSAIVHGPVRVGFGDQSGSGLSTYSFRVALTPMGSNQNDAGSGCDAPNTSGTAMEVGTRGELQGRLAYNAGDKEDWYRYSAPVCSVWTVKVQATSGSFWAGIYGDDASFHDHAFVTGTFERTVVAKAFHLGLGDQNGFGTASYRVSVTAVPTDNLACLLGMQVI